jgi:hypothetical protein
MKAFIVDKYRATIKGMIINAGLIMDNYLVVPCFGAL